MKTCYFLLFGFFISAFYPAMLIAEETADTDLHNAKNVALQFVKADAERDWKKAYVLLWSRAKQLWSEADYSKFLNASFQKSVAKTPEIFYSSLHADSPGFAFVMIRSADTPGVIVSVLLVKEEEWRVVYAEPLLSSYLGRKAALDSLGSFYCANGLFSFDGDRDPIDDSSAAQILAIANTYLSCAKSGDYRLMRKYASDEIVKAIAEASRSRSAVGSLKSILVKCPENRSINVLYKNENSAIKNWYISSIIHKPENMYEIVLSCYLGNGGITTVRAIVGYENGRYVVTQW